MANAKEYLEYCGSCGFFLLLFLILFVCMFLIDRPGIYVVTTFSACMHIVYFGINGTEIILALEYLPSSIVYPYQ